MIVQSLRSSSYTKLDFCEQAYLLEYCLNLPSKSDKASTHIGSVVHYVLETCATAKLAKQKRKKNFVDENFGKMSVDIDMNHILDLSFEKVKTEAFPALSASDKEMCRELMMVPINYKNGLFSPLHRKIVAPEQYFDFEIKKDWAKYCYDIDGKKVSGYLTLRGTIDLLVEFGDGLELIDWKTGARKDWSKPIWAGEKTYEDLRKDPQLRLYHYAAHHLYPDIKHIQVTIFYLKTGPESICFDENDLELTEKMIKDRFERIKRTVKPKLIYPNKKCSWCHYSKNDVDNNPVGDYSESSCRKITDSVIQIGLERTTEKYRKKDVIYSGGGATKKLENE